MATRRFVSALARGAAVLVVSLVVAASPAGAAPGDLDPTFGSGGIVTTDIAGGDDLANAAVLQPDGKIVVAGSTDVDGNVDFALARYLSGGALDPTFGVGGIVITDFAGGFDAANSVVLQPDGKLIAAGEADSVFALARYLPDGTLDLTFGTSGKAATDLAGGFEAIEALALQPDGKIVATGVADGFVVVRYLPDGALDPDFGMGGIVAADLATFGFANAVVVQPDGKLLVSGLVVVDDQGLLMLTRYLSDGALDPDFGVDGIVTTAFPGLVVDTFVVENDLVLQPDGKIVVAAELSGDTPSELAVARYLPDGTLDPAFGDQGIVRPGIQSQTHGEWSVILQPDGRIVTGGHSFDFPGPDLVKFTLVHFHADGTPDPDFGSNGVITTAFEGGDSLIRALLLQANGNLLAVGSVPGNGTPTSLGRDFGLVRYQGQTSNGNDGGGDPHHTYGDNPGDPGFDFDTPFEDPQTTTAANPVQDVAGTHDSVLQPAAAPPAPSAVLNDKAQPAPSDVAPTAAAELPRTGTAIGNTIRLGVLLAALGGLTILISRRRTARA